MQAMALAYTKPRYIFPVKHTGPCDFAGTTLKLPRSCRVTSSTVVGFWLYIFIVNVNHAESEENVSSCVFYLCTALDSSIPFSTAVYIVGLGWFSIVITLKLDDTGFVS